MTPGGPLHTRLTAFSMAAGKPCSTDQSLCNGRNELCIGRGPAFDADDHGYESNTIIATKQFEKARDLWYGNGTHLSGARFDSSEPSSTSVKTFVFFSRETAVVCWPSCTEWRAPSETPP